MARPASLLKRIPIIVITLVVVVLITLAAAVVLIDPNDYREDIEQAVAAHTGRSLNIEGEISLSLFPWLGVEIGALRLGNAEGFGEPPMAQIEAAELRVRLLPLLRRQLEVGTLVLDGLALALERDSAGRNNWDDLLERLEAAEDKPDAAPPQAGKGAFDLDTLVIHALDIRRARVHWDDRETDTRLALERFNLLSGRIVLAEPFAVDSDFVLSMEKPALTAVVALEGALMANPRAGRYALDQLRLEAGLSGDDVPGGEQTLHLASDISVDIEEDSARFEDLRLDFAGLQMAGELRLSRLTEELPVMDLPLSIAEFSPHRVADRLALALPPMADEQALASASGRLRIHGTAERLGVSDVQFTFDDTRVRGSGLIEPGEPAWIVSRVQLDQLDADRYLPPPEDPEPESPAPLLPDDIELPLALLPLADFDLRLEIDALRLAEMDFSAFDMRAINRDSVLRIAPISAGFYGGNLLAELRLDGRPGRLPALGLMLELQDIQAGPLARDLLAQEHLSGVLNLRLDVAGVGADSGALKRTLGGDVVFSFEEGRLHEFDLARRVNDAYLRYRGHDPDPEREAVATEIGEARGSGRISEGVLRNNDLTVRSQVMRGSGEGRIDLVRERLDYVLTVEFIDDTGRGIDRYLRELRGVPVPVRLRGPLLDPSVSVPLDDVLEARAREELRREQERLRERAERELERQREQIEQRARDRLRQFLP